MSAAFFLPVAAAVVFACLGGVLQRRLPPRLSAPLLASLAAVAAGALAVAVGVVSAAFLAEVHVLDGWIGWCRHLYPPHDRIPAGAGLAATATFGAMAVSGARALRRTRTRATTPAPAVVIVEQAEPMAHSLPGRPGQIVVSRGMLDALLPDERAVLFAHERSHLLRGHHRYVRVGDVAAALAPVLWRVAGHLRLATERWADEDAAREVGDRTVVARAIARAALASHGTPPAGALAAGGLGVEARVRALLRTSPPSTGLPVVALGAVVATVAGAGSVVELHHGVAFLSHVCAL